MTRSQGRMKRRRRIAGSVSRCANASEARPWPVSAKETGRAEAVLLSKELPHGSTIEGNTPHRR